MKFDLIKIFGILLVLSGLICFLVIGNYYRTGREHLEQDQKKAEQFYEELSQIPEPDQSVDGLANGTGKVDFSWATNPDTVGWISIPGTQLEFPIVQCGDNDYYLMHNYDKQYDRHGAVFADAYCDLDKPQRNLLIYGHHMKDGTMFASLDAYKKEEYLHSHSQVILYGMDGTGTEYQLLNAFYWDESDASFPYFTYYELGEDAVYAEFMEELKKVCIFPFDETLWTKSVSENGREVLMLSTCDYRTGNSRFVVVGVKEN